LKDDYGNEITENHEWTTKNFNDNQNCISRHSHRNIIHTTGYYGKNVPSFGHSSVIVGFGPHITDLGFNSGNLFKNSFNLFDEIEKEFDKSFNSNLNIENKN